MTIPEGTISAEDTAEARFALNVGIGDKAAEYFFQAAGGQLAGFPTAVVAYRDSPDLVYLLIDDTNRDHKPQATSKAVFMLEAAISVTKLLGTMVIPVDPPFPPSPERWRGLSRGPFAAYRFKVVDVASSIHHG